jgi:protein kinase A
MLSVHMKKYICYQLILMIDFLHNVNGLAHLDLKPDNIIIKDDFSFALIDFGQPIPINSPRPYTRNGTPFFWSPE